MSAIETVLLCLGAAAALAVLLMPPPPPRRSNWSPPKALPPTPRVLQPPERHTMNGMTITKQQLDQCFLDWERDHRAGKCLDYEANKARPAEDVSREASDWMWYRLEQQQALVSNTAAPEAA